MITFSRASILLASASLLVGAPAAFAQDIQAQDDGSLADLTAP
ncbi:MAG: hypothetical protein RIQ99_656, partial [Pseudomonadota bacterium]